MELENTIEGEWRGRKMNIFVNVLHTVNFLFAHGITNYGLSTITVTVHDQYSSQHSSTAL